MPACCTSKNCCCQCPWPCSRPLSTHTSARDSQTFTGKSGSVSCGVPAPFSWKLVCTRFCLCPPRVSVSPVPWKFCNQIPLTFKIRIPGDSQSLCCILRLGSLLWSLELSQQCEFFSIIVLQFVDHPPRGCMVGLMATTSSKRTYDTCHASQDYCCQCPCPHGRPLLTHASTETLKHPEAGVAQSRVGITAPFPGSWLKGVVVISC